jgi:hypothetical protein
MKQYLLSVIQPDGDPPPAEFLARVVRDLGVLQQELEAAGAWVFKAGLHPPATATVVRFTDGEALMTDGPFVEGKEHVGGFAVIRAPDLDAALVWARRFAQATTLPIEVRPMRDSTGG